MIRVVLAVVLTVSIGGCTSRMIAERDDAYCQAQGTKPGSQAYFQCRLKQAIH
ncbi:MAG: hypothetical protein J0G37_01925 [Afipia sp.]|jgi:hypothetical protein|nr:hypothetical protein [Afipia sp.]